MKVLVTGATGFMGTHIVKKLLEKGCAVVGLDKDDFYFWEHLESQIELHKMDIRDILTHSHLFKGVDVIVHCAAALHDSPEELIYSVNLGGTRAALELCLCNKIPKFIFCSSTVVYGYFEYQPPVAEETPLAPEHPYAVSKVKCEKIVHEYQKKGVNGCIVRPKSFTGAGRFGVFQMLCDWICHGARIPVIGKGTNRYQLLGVSDLAEGIYRLATLPVYNETINLGADRFRTVREDLTDLLAYADTGSRLLFLPAAPVKLALTIIDKFNLTQMWSWHYKTADKNCYVDITKAQKLIDWAPAQSTLDALKETYDWYVANVHRFEGKTGLGHHGVLWREKLLSFVRNLLSIRTGLRRSSHPK